MSHKNNVDWNVRRETPAGKASPGRPHRRKAPRRLPDRPRKASAWSGDLIFTLTQKTVTSEFFCGYF
ncbi:hypothetical protein KEH51_03345 [[Brevibacterium] frigoritolerans]|uniref:Uncharacterized protein n=1 Tax=Peribacillus frigoritolerans TaxID=450367 RepID=A0A941FJS3_9BACI|nr:hypothetical protein [Peribacillus frigoritolerans]